MRDMISREAAIEALGERPTVWTDDDQYTLGERNQYDIDRLAIETLPSAQPDLQEYSVWFRIGETLVDVSKMHITAEEGIEKIRSYLVRMKKPERKVGKWMLADLQIQAEMDNGNYCYNCSNCGKGDIHAKSAEVPFCWWCGARMVEGEDGELA